MTRKVKVLGVIWLLCQRCDRLIWGRQPGKLCPPCGHAAGQQWPGREDIEGEVSGT